LDGHEKIKLELIVDRSLVWYLTIVSVCLFLQSTSTTQY